jgi:hypothetical protein
MTKQTDAMRLADKLEDVALNAYAIEPAVAELRRLEHNNQVLMNALMKACGDDEQMVKEIIESQGELK